MTQLKKAILNGYVVGNYSVDQFDGEVVYEVIRLIQGKPLFLKEHVERLDQSLLSKGITELLSEADLRYMIHALRKVERLDNHNVKVMIRKKEEMVETLIFYNPTSYPEEELYEKGIHTVFVDLYRKDPNVKAVNWTFNDQVAALKERTGAFECILEHDGLVTEGSRSNLFFYKDRTFYTADASQVLIGITRLKIMEAIEILGYGLVEKRITKEDVASFQGAFISGTSLGVLPIDTIGDQVFGSSNIKAIQDVRVAYEKIMVEDITEGI